MYFLFSPSHMQPLHTVPSTTEGWQHWPFPVPSLLSILYCEGVSRMHLLGESSLIPKPETSFPSIEFL